MSTATDRYKALGIVCELCERLHTGDYAICVECDTALKAEIAPSILHEALYKALLRCGWIIPTTEDEVALVEEISGKSASFAGQ